MFTSTRNIVIAILLSVLWNTSSYAGIVSYLIDASGNISASYNDIRFYNINNSSGAYWKLDANTNTVSFSPAGTSNILNTTLFTVSDIVDLTYSLNNQAWVTTAGNHSYLIDSTGNVTANLSNVRFYNINNNPGFYWKLDDLNNTITNSLTGTTSTLNTTLFRVSDITDLSYTLDNQAWVTTNSNHSYLIDYQGNISATFNDIRYYNISNLSPSYWMLDSSNNTVMNINIGTKHILNTSLFSVTDIQDITYTLDNQAWVTVANKTTIPAPYPIILIITGLFYLFPFAAIKK